MAKERKPVLRQRVFEALYEHGYRYLDRCGETMLILEELLTDQTQRVCLPTQMVPTGARMECPDLDLQIAFDTHKLIVDQNPVGNLECDFDDIAVATLSTLIARFDIQKIRRFGARRIRILGCDSLDDADALSLRFPLGQDWRKNPTKELLPRASSGTLAFESKDRSKGIRIVTAPSAKVGADVKIDERLKRPPHHLPQGQREVLLDQLKRRKARQFDPEAGLAIDIDYCWMWPPKEASANDFLAEAWREADRLEKDFLAGEGQT